jgi:hypothetical protein
LVHGWGINNKEHSAAEPQGSRLNNQSRMNSGLIVKA